MSGDYARTDGEPGDVECGLLNEEFGLVHLLGLDDLPTAGRYAEGVFLGGKRCRGNHPPRQGQRVRRLPCEWLCKAGGKDEKDSPEPHDK